MTRADRTCIGLGRDARRLARVLGLVLGAAVASSPGTAEPPSLGSPPSVHAFRGAPAVSPFHSLERYRAHVELRAGAELLRQNRDAELRQRASGIRRGGNAADVRRLRVYVERSEQLDHLRLRSEIEAVDRRAARHRLRALETSLGSPSLHPDARPFLAQRHADLLDLLRAHEADRELDSLERDVARSEEKEKPASPFD